MRQKLQHKIHELHYRVEILCHQDFQIRNHLTRQSMRIKIYADLNAKRAESANTISNLKI